jgi:CDP-diacylglycerol--glycerol-3-phosphate 3-phosphatidyltransferase
MKMELPNILTIVRIAIAPLFLMFFMIDTFWSLMISLGLFIVAELTDYFDGIVARKNKQETFFGKLMDPFADSISRFTVFLCFLGKGLAPVWLIVIFFYRDVLVSVIRVFAMKEGLVVSARKSGKTKAWVQALCIFMVFVILILQKLGIITNPYFRSSHTHYAIFFIGIAALITIWSAFDYWHNNKKIIFNALKVKAD